MTKKLILSTVSSVLLLVGCGGGGGDSAPVDPMTEKDAIVITYHVPAELCLSAELRDIMLEDIPEATDYLARSEVNTVNCATYGKYNEVTETGGCITMDLSFEDPFFAQFDQSCVIGFNLSQNSTISDIQLLENIQVAIAVTMDTFN